MFKDLFEGCFFICTSGDGKSELGGVGKGGTGGAPEDAEGESWRLGVEEFGVVGRDLDFLEGDGKG